MGSAFNYQGFNVTAWATSGFADKSLDLLALNYVKSEGSNFIAIDYAVNFNDDGSIVSNGTGITPPLADIQYVIDQAHGMGLQVFLKPHATLATTGQNRNTSNTDPAKFSTVNFFRDWGAYLTNLATQTKSENVEGIVIGTEMNVMDSGHRSEWAALIGSLRNVYPGKLTYDALVSFVGDVDVRNVVFWDLLDFISVSLYVPLTESSTYTLDSLKAAMTNGPYSGITNVVDYLHALSTKYGKSVLALEGGYQSVTNGLSLAGLNAFPSETKTVSNQVQADGLTAYLDVLEKYKGDWFAGTSLWQATPSILSDQALKTIDHTQEFGTYQKPGAVVIKSYYTGATTYADTNPNYIGTSGSDRIVGSVGNNVIRGGAGNDTLLGGSSNDIIYGNGIATPEHTVIKIYANADILDSVGALMNVVLDGVTILQGTEVKAARANGITEGAAQEIDITIPYKPSVSSLEIFFTNEEYRGGTLDRNLYVRNVVVDDISLTKAGSVYHPGFGIAAQPGSWDMGAGGYLELDLAPVISMKQQASSDSNVMQGGIGNDTLYGDAGTDTAIYSGKRASFHIVRTGTNYTVMDNAGTEGTDTLANIEKLQFGDMTVNLAIGDAAGSIALTDLKSLEELYVAFFNRVPDADGLGYWIGQLKNGQSLNSIAESFYNAALAFSNLTGYSATMTNNDFVKVIYKNVLGRSGQTAPPDADVSYWAGELANGHASKGNLISTMLSSAHSFKGDATWGWVANLLDNKVTVADYFAVQQGLGYVDSNDAITNGMAIAAAVTPAGTSAAIALVGVADAGFSLA